MFENLFPFQEELRMVFQLILSAGLGALVGMEREHVGKAAGLRTFALVSLGSALFTIISIDGFSFLEAQGSAYDPSRMAGQVVLGVGFIGAGLIVFRGYRVEGLTTASGLWVAAAIGVATGVGFYFIAVFTAVLVLAILYLLRRLEPLLGSPKDFGPPDHL